MQSGLGRKLARRFAGPCKVLQAAGTLTDELKLPTELCIHPVFHVSALEEYKRFPGNYMPPLLRTLIDGQLEYEVDRIKDTRGEGKKREYRVCWVGYTEPTWEGVGNITNSPDNLQKILQSRIQCPHTISDGTTPGALRVNISF